MNRAFTCQFWSTLLIGFTFKFLFLKHSSRKDQKRDSNLRQQWREGVKGRITKWSTLCRFFDELEWIDHRSKSLPKDSEESDPIPLNKLSRRLKQILTQRLDHIMSHIYEKMLSLVVHTIRLNGPMD